MSVIIPSFFFNPSWIRDIAEFLAHAGASFRYGPQSNQAIMDRGVAVSCEEFCLPLKLFCGHISSLSKACEDRVLVPVFVGNDSGDSFPCHLQQRARDIAVNLDLIKPERVLSPCFTYDDSLGLLDGGFLELGRMLGIPELTVTEALKIRGRAQGPARVTELVPGSAFRIAITGNPAITGDALLGGGIRKMFAELGAETFIPDMERFSLAGYPKDFRHFTFDALTRIQIEAAFRDPSIDGIVFLQPFLCGPCCNTAMDYSKTSDDKPFLTIVVDQGKSTAGTQTRLEAFLDIVKSQKGEDA